MRSATSCMPRGSRSRTLPRARAGRSELSRMARQPRGRDGEWVVGRNPVVEALRARVPAGELYVATGAGSDSRVREAVQSAADARCPIVEVPRRELDRLTGGATHQGLALKLTAYDYAHPDDLLAVAREAGAPPLVVALDGITDPRNLGAVVRSAAAFGAHGVVVPERRAAGMSTAAWKASAGAAARLRVARAVNLSRQLTVYAKAGLTIVGLDADGPVSLAEVRRGDEGLVLVIGAEGRGLGRLVSEKCDLLARIPISRDTESLNASVAAGIALYELTW
ncbi:MAG: 23S rRNA (guanosine(2251)-2'-O)-methyltransferase RlmB [Propionibacteriales bacterium]|nr:23S rRNA (guanosine(2251)-2'-O)-methyltransferase RlmB [Propionibacteriales bacterium]